MNKMCCEFPKLQICPRELPPRKSKALRAIAQPRRGRGGGGLFQVGNRLHIFYKARAGDHNASRTASRAAGGIAGCHVSKMSTTLALLLALFHT